LIIKNNTRHLCFIFGAETKEILIFDWWGHHFFFEIAMLFSLLLFHFKRFIWTRWLQNNPCKKIFLKQFSYLTYLEKPSRQESSYRAGAISEAAWSRYQIQDRKFKTKSYLSEGQIQFGSIFQDLVPFFPTLSVKYWSELKSKQNQILEFRNYWV
jgi:hypothetical protein